MAMTRSLRSTGITPLHHYKETASPQAMAPMAYRPRYRRRGNDLPAFHSLWVGKAGGELLRGSPPLSGASGLSASRFVPLVPFPFASSTRFSRSVQEPG